MKAGESRRRLFRPFSIAPPVLSARPLLARALVLGFGLLRSLHHAGNICQQLLGVVHNTVLNRIFDAANALWLSGFIVKLHGARAVQDLEVLKRVFLNDNQIRQQPFLNQSILDGLALRLEDFLRPMQRRSSDDLQRMKARLLQEFHFLYIAEAVELVDEAGIGADSDAPASVLVVIKEGHPALIEVAPV